MKVTGYRVQGTEKQVGFSLVELLVVIASVGIMILLIANIPSSMNLVNKSKHQSIAREIATKAVEDTRAITYVNLANGVTPIIDPGLDSLPSGSGTKEIKDCDPTVCTNEELIKELEVKVLWKELGKDMEYKIKTLISQGGLEQ